MIVSVGRSTYEMSQAMFNTARKMAKEKYEKENVNAIYAIEKPGSGMMMNQVFETLEDLEKELKVYKIMGFKVYKHIKS